MPFKQTLGLNHTRLKDLRFYLLGMLQGGGRGGRERRRWVGGGQLAEFAAPQSCCIVQPTMPQREPTRSQPPSGHPRLLSWCPWHREDGRELRALAAWFCCLPFREATTVFLVNNMVRARQVLLRGPVVTYML